MLGTPLPTQNGPSQISASKLLRSVICSAARSDVCPGGGRRKLGHNDAVFRTSGGARLRALHLAEYLDTQRWRLTKTRMETKAVLVGILRGMVAIELVIRDALALEHRQYMGTDVVDHLVVPGNRHARGGARPSCPPCRQAACKPATATLSSGPAEALD